MQLLSRSAPLGLLLLTALGLGGWSARVQDPEDPDTARAIREAVRELHDLRARRRTLEDEARQGGKDAARTTLELEGELERARTERQREEERLAGTAARADEVRQELDRLDGLARARSEAARALLERWRPVVANGVPFAREQRLATVDRILTDLGEDAELAVEGLVETASFLKDELRLGATLESRRERVVLEGGSLLPHAEIVRIGLALEAMRTEDGRLVGLFHEGRWDTELPPRVRVAVEELLNAVVERGTPRPVAVPFPPTTRRGVR